MLLLIPAQAQSIKIGLKDNGKILYITANQDYLVLEDQSDKQGDFDTVSNILANTAGQKVLVRSSPAAANDLVIASPPLLATTSAAIKFTCSSELNKKLRINNFSSKEVFKGNYSDVEIAEVPKQNKPCLFKIKISSTDSNPNNIFRGEIIIIPHKTHFAIINRLDSEDYLQSVVASEVSSNWHPEALKTQAVAARTYTLSQLGRRKDLGYDLKSGVEDQMYLGYNRETLASTQAVKSTKGEFLVDRQGLLVDAYYYSHAGNFSSNPEDVWGLTPKHYLQGVREVTPNKQAWQVKLTLKEIQEKLKDLKLDYIKAITITERSPEGRAKQVLISGLQTGKLKHIVLSGEEFRHHLGLRSTNMKLNWSRENPQQVQPDLDPKRGFFARLFSPFDGKEEEHTAIKPQSMIHLNIEGQGYGHGIGLSQYDTKFLAEKGAKYQEILGHYYQGAKLVKP